MDGIDRPARGRRPRPVLIAGAYVGVAEAVVALVSVVLDLGPELTAALLGVVGAVGSLVASLVSQRLVTPSSDPQDDSGRSLVPYGGNA